MAWPLVVNALRVQLMLMIDILLVAPLGAMPLAAIGIATAVWMFALGLEFLIDNGVQMLVVRAYGS